MPALPRAILFDPRGPALEAALAACAKPLWDGGTLPVAHLTLDETLERALNEVQNQNRLTRGLEQAETVLRNEQKGLDHLRKRDGAAPVNRTSRLLIIGDDGSERFYRQCEALLVRFEDRLLGLRVADPQGRFAARLYGAGALVKAVLVADRDGVTHILASQLVD